MRGVLLITVAVILIVLGLRTSDSGGAVAAGDPVHADLDPVSGSSTRVENQPPVQEEGPGSYGANAAEAELPPPSDEELPFVLKDDPADVGGGDASPHSDLPDPTRVDPVAPWDGNNSSEGGDPSHPGKAFVLGSLTGDTGPLAVALLEAWIEQSPARLQEQLDKAEPSEASEEQGQLVTAFWQSMVGHPEMAKEHWSSLSQQAFDTPAQLAMLAAAMEFDNKPSVPENAGRKDPLARSMRMVLLEAAAARYADSGAHADAARTLSELLTSEVLAPWEPHREALEDWAARLNVAQGYHRLNPRGDWPCLTYTVAPNESLELIRKRVVRQNPGLLMCTGLISEVNRVGKYIHAGDVLKIPTAPSNMLVDLDARMAFYRHGSEIVMAWPVGIGREGHATPLGTFTIGDKLKEPVWTRRGKEPLPYGHPENLLGARWLGWYQDGTKTDYGFHGTNDPDGVGGRVSSGCIRMRNEDVSVLFELLPTGSQVVVQQ